MNACADTYYWSELETLKFLKTNTYIHTYIHLSHRSGRTRTLKHTYIHTYVHAYIADSNL